MVFHRKSRYLSRQLTELHECFCWEYQLYQYVVEVPHAYFLSSHRILKRYIYRVKVKKIYIYIYTGLKFDSISNYYYFLEDILKWNWSGFPIIAWQKTMKWQPVVCDNTLQHPWLRQAPFGITWKSGLVWWTPWKCLQDPLWFKTVLWQPPGRRHCTPPSAPPHSKAEKLNNTDGRFSSTYQSDWNNLSGEFCLLT